MIASKKTHASIGGELKLLEAETGKCLTKDTLYEVQWLPADIILVNKKKEDMDMCHQIRY